MYVHAFVLVILLCFAQEARAVRAAQTNDTVKKEEGRTAFDRASPYKYQISHVGNYPPVSRSLYNVDPPDSDGPLLPAQQTISIEQQPSARSSSYGVEEKVVIGLGDACASDYECAHIKSGVRCLGGVCACAYDTAQLANLACLPRAKHLGDRCVLSEQCKNLDPLATCYQNTCMCEPIYHVAGDIGSPTTGPSSLSYGGRQGSLVGCLKKRNLGESCKDTLQCAYKVYNSYCDARSRVCKCNFGFTPTGDEQCGPLADALGQPCVVNAQCGSLMHAFCGPSGTCQCEDTERFVQVQTAGSDRRKRQAGGTGRLQMCLPAVDLGQNCMVSAQCKKRTRNSDCIGGTCQCVTGFVQRDPFVNECLPLIKGIGYHSPPCSISTQCMQPNSFCNGTINRCDCDKAHCTVGYTCKRRVWHEEPCDNNCQCQTPNTICKDGWCQCTKNTCYSESMKRCLPRMLKFAADPFEFVAPCCGDLSRNRCFGQLTFAMSFMNCSGKPSFNPTSLNGNPTILIDQNGGLMLSGSTTLSMFNQQQAQQQQLSNVQITATTTVTVTATTSDGLTATTAVIIKPDRCCTQIPSATMSSVTVNIERINNATLCASGAPGTGNTAGNGFNLFDLNNLFVMPCGERPFITSATATATTGFTAAAAGPPVIPQAMCFVQNGILGYIGAITSVVGSTAIATCSLVVTTLGCNGQTATSTVTFNLACSA